MEQNRIDELVAKYNEGLADPTEIAQLESLIESGRVALTQLRSLDHLETRLAEMETPVPSLAMDDTFYAMLAREKKKGRPSFSFTMPSFSWLAPRLAMAVVLIGLGFGGGYYSRTDGNSDVAELTKQVAELKETMMLSMLEKESASDRLKAVSLTSDMSHVSRKVTAALFQTLNHDPSVNVRLSALDALVPYSREVEVRAELIRSIAVQDSPLVQMALAELMVKLQEKKSVDEFKKLLEDDKTPEEVKSRIKESINVLS